MIIRTFAIAALFSLSTIADADSLDQLKSFVSSTKSMSSSFSQSVTNRKNQVTQQASGRLYIQRPGKFRWEYAKPYEQLIVGDGTRLWLYDKDLDQVTVKKLDQALGSSPAALLAGNNDLEKSYTLKDIGTGKDGREWLEATPKSSDSTFQSVRMGFSQNTLVVMELRDNFGQTTSITFSKLERNPGLGSDLFKFVPPKGTDVIGD